MSLRRRLLSRATTWGLGSRSPSWKGQEKVLYWKKINSLGCVPFPISFHKKNYPLNDFSAFNASSRAETFLLKPETKKKSFPAASAFPWRFFYGWALSITERSERFSFSDVFSRISFCFNLNFHKNLRSFINYSLSFKYSCINVATFPSCGFCSWCKKVQTIIL